MASPVEISRKSRGKEISGCGVRVETSIASPFASRRRERSRSCTLRTKFFFMDVALTSMKCFSSSIPGRTCSTKGRGATSTGEESSGCSVRAVKSSSSCPSYLLSSVPGRSSSKGGGTKSSPLRSSFAYLPRIPSRSKKKGGRSSCSTDSGETEVSASLRHAMNPGSPP
jgi:hypothetical protein